MGKEIVYCGGCGKSLHEDEFDRGEARTIDNRPYCAKCRPPASDPIPRKNPTPGISSAVSSKAAPKVSTARISVLSPGRNTPRKIATSHIPALPATTRRAKATSPAPSSRMPWIAGAVLVGLGILILAGLASGRKQGRTPLPPLEPAANPPAPLPRSAESAPPEANRAGASLPRAPERAPERPTPPEDPAQALRQLESLAASAADADAVLVKCEEIRAKLRGTPQERRFREIEDTAHERKTRSNQERQISKALQGARELMATPFARERRVEILDMLRAARGIAEGRRDEVDQLIAEFEKRLRESDGKADGAPAEPPPPPALERKEGSAARRVILVENFDQGRGRFVGGEIVEGGVNSSKALAVPKTAVWTENVFSAPITAATTIRFKVKPLIDIPSLGVMLWSNKIKDNCWYHVRGLKKGEWNVVEFKVMEARGGWSMNGPSLEGDIPFNVRIYFEDKAENGRMLLDDFELSE